VFTTARLDQAVDSVGSTRADRKIHLSNRGTMTLPLEMDVTFNDGSSERIRLPVEMWNQGPRFAYRLRSDKPVRRVVIDPRGVLPDINRANNAVER
jgi:hypothetical protein